MSYNQYSYPPPYIQQQQVPTCSGIITTTTCTSGYAWITTSSCGISGSCYQPNIIYNPINITPSRSVIFHDAFTIEPDSEGNLKVVWDAKLDERNLFLSVDKVNKLLQKFLDSEDYEYTRRILKLALEEEIINEVTKHFSV